MIKLFAKTKIAYFALCAFMFLFSYLIRLNLGVPFFLIILYISFKPDFAKIKNARLLNLAFLFLVSFAAGYFLLKNGLTYYFIPIAIIPMLSDRMMRKVDRFSPIPAFHHCAPDSAIKAINAACDTRRAPKRSTSREFE